MSYHQFYIVTISGETKEALIENNLSFLQSLGDDLEGVELSKVRTKKQRERPRTRLKR